MERHHQNFGRSGIRVTKISTWQVVLAAIVILSLGLALAVVATGVFLIAFPLVLIAGAAYRIFGSRLGSQPSRSKPGPTHIIDGEYVVIEKEDKNRP